MSILCRSLLAVMSLACAACVQDDPRGQDEEAAPPKGALVIEVLLSTCDLRHPGASCRSNDVCGVCDIGGVDVWFWREGGACSWVFTDAGATPDTDPQGWDVCQSHGGPMDHRTRTP